MSAVIKLFKIYPQQHFMKAIVTGGAGFIGSYVVERLLREGYEVTVIDNMSSGRKELLKDLNVTIVEEDLLSGNVTEHFEGADEVYHFAANPDVKIGNTDTTVHFEQNLVVTHRVLEASRKAGVKKFVFASSSTVYGETDAIPTPEDSRTEPISMYGASKLACESLISSYAHSFGMKAYVFRFANVIGGRSTHGVIFDFVRKLRENPGELEILGDGTQNKSYVYIDDCVDAVMTVMGKSERVFQVFNVGSEDQTDVKTLASIVSREMGISPKFRFTGGDRGWKGDVPKMMLDIGKIKALGWSPKHNSSGAVRETAKSLLTC
jgi:UDP-glucose 4-epimerase